MIIGTGIDLVDVRRIEKLMEEHEERFLNKYFTQNEMIHFSSLPNVKAKMMSIAKRFAAKEACAKALGTGFRNGIYMKNIEIKNDSAGKPELHVTEGALTQLESMIRKGQKAYLFLSLTDEPPYAQAQVIIETY